MKLQLAITGLCTLNLKKESTAKNQPPEHSGELLLVDSREPVEVNDAQSLRTAMLPEHRPLLTFRLGDLQRADSTTLGARTINVDSTGEETVSLPLSPWVHEESAPVSVRLGWGDLEVGSAPGLFKCDQKFDDYVPDLNLFNISDIYSTKNVLAKVEFFLSGVLSAGPVISYKGQAVEWYFKKVDLCGIDKDDAMATKSLKKHKISNHILVNSSSMQALNIQVGGADYFLAPEKGDTIYLSISNLPEKARLTPLLIKKNMPVEHLLFYGKLARNTAMPIYLPHAVADYGFTKTGGGICPGTKKTT